MRERSWDVRKGFVNKQKVPPRNVKVTTKYFSRWYPYAKYERVEDTDKPFFPAQFVVNQRLCHYWTYVRYWFSSEKDVVWPRWRREIIDHYDGLSIGAPVEEKPVWAALYINGKSVDWKRIGERNFESYMDRLDVPAHIPEWLLRKFHEFDSEHGNVYADGIHRYFPSDQMRLSELRSAYVELMRDRLTEYWSHVKRYRNPEAGDIADRRMRCVAAALKALLPEIDVAGVFVTNAHNLPYDPAYTYKRADLGSGCTPGFIDPFVKRSNPAGRINLFYPTLPQSLVKWLDKEEEKWRGANPFSATIMEMGRMWLEGDNFNNYYPPTPAEIVSLFLHDMSIPPTWSYCQAKTRRLYYHTVPYITTERYTHLDYFTMNLFYAAVRIDGEGYTAIPIPFALGVDVGTFTKQLDFTGAYAVLLFKNHVSEVEAAARQAGTRLGMNKLMTRAVTFLEDNAIELATLQTEEEAEELALRYVSAQRGFGA